MKNIPSAKPFFNQKQVNFINKSVTSILKSGELILGPYTKLFEKKFAKYIGTKYAVATNSCTSALEIALRFCDVKDKEVIVPTNTFVASANAVIFAGGIPVLTDIDKESLCLDFDSLVTKINNKTRAVIVVHIGGLPHPQIEEIKNICIKRKLFLIEDVAHAVGASIGQKKAGNLGDAACFSFYPTKIITTGVGGMITTNNKKLANYATILRHHGAVKGLEDVHELGNDWIMDEIRAAVGISQLNDIEKIIEKRIKIANRYKKNIKILGIHTLQKFTNIRHVYYKYPILLKSKKIRVKLKKILKNTYGIETGSIYYPAVHQMPLFKKMFTYNNNDFSVADNILPRVLCLPIFIQMTNKEIDYVINCLKKSIKQL